MKNINKLYLNQKYYIINNINRKLNNNYKRKHMNVKNGKINIEDWNIQNQLNHKQQIILHLEIEYWNQELNNQKEKLE